MSRTRGACSSQTLANIGLPQQSGHRRNRRVILLVILTWPIREIKAMIPEIEELNRLKAVERAAHARLDRLNRTCPASDEVIKVAKEYWKEAAESLRDFQEV